MRTENAKRCAGRPFFDPLRIRGGFVVDENGKREQARIPTNEFPESGVVRLRKTRVAWAPASGSGSSSVMATAISASAPLKTTSRTPLLSGSWFWDRREVK